MTGAAALGNQQDPQKVQLSIYLSLAWRSLFPIYLVLALVPKRLIQDRLTGTYLAPR